MCNNVRKTVGANCRAQATLNALSILLWDIPKIIYSDSSTMPEYLLFYYDKFSGGFKEELGGQNQQ